MKKTIILLFLLVCITVGTYAQGKKKSLYALENETVVYSFKTDKGKIMTICTENSGKYIVYRFGSKDKVELEYPKVKDESSWKLFFYSFYFRGGGTQNEGMDMNYVAFTNENVKYVIYDNYYSNGNVSETGVKIIDPKTKKTTVIRAKKGTKQGGLVKFRIDGTLVSSDELYD